MESAALEQEIVAFNAMLPKLRQEYGSVWAVLVDRAFKASFADFGQAAKYAVENFPDKPFLIRHTEQHAPHIPFVAIEA